MYRKSPQSITTKQAIENIIKYSQSHNNLLEKFNTDFFLSYFDRYTIEQLQQKEGKNKKYTKKKFIKELTCFIMHRPDETLFLVINLIDIFNKIVNDTKCDNEISIKDFTYYLCQSISKKQAENQVHNKEISIEKIHPNSKKIRQIDINPAEIISHADKQVPKISRNIKKKQKKVDNSKPLHLFFYNRDKKQIITLARLASHITIFNMNLKEIKFITPSCFKQYQNKMAISSMAFSQRQQRIGCIISQLGMAFWDYQDNFQTLKLIKKIIGQKIYYLPLLDEWATTSANKIYFWDLKFQKIKQVFGQQRSININDINQIPHLRCLAVSYTLDDQFKWLYIYRNDGMKVGSKRKLSRVGAQKIHYNKCTQALILLGNNQLPIYHVDQLSLDLSLLATLSGHQSIITSIGNLQQGLIVTGDDRGIMKIWDLKSLRCQQVIQVAHYIKQIVCSGNNLIFSDSRINIMQIQHLTQQMPLSQLYGIKKFYRLENPIYEVYIFTTINCRIYDLKTGKVVKIIQICYEEQIITVQKLTNDFLISTTKGSLLCYSEDLTLKWKINNNKYHQEEISHIRADLKNKFFTTIGKEGNINIWSEKALFQEGPRKIVQNNVKNLHFEVTVFDLSEKFSIIITSQNSACIRIWDYQSCKLHHVIQLQSVACSAKISDQYPLLTVGCMNEKIYLYKIERKQNIFSVSFLRVVNLRYPEDNLNSLISINTFSEIKFRQDIFKSLNCNKIIIYHKNKNHLLILSYGKGNIIVFDINKIILFEFKNYCYSKLTVNIQRPIRQTLEKQLIKNQILTTQRPAEEHTCQQNLVVVWNKNLHKDTITDIDNFQHKYISTLSCDGYLKIASIEKCEIICSLCIRYPLPIIWRFSPFQYEEMGGKIFQTLSILSDIINSKDQQLHKYELDILNVQPFMKQICQKKPKSTVETKKEHIHLLKDELDPEDLRNVKVNTSEESLKYLQAFRRVNIIKDIKQSKQNYVDGHKKIYSSTEDKQSLQKLLSPNYFPNLCGRQDVPSQKINKFQLMLTKSMSVSHANSYLSLKKLASKQRSKMMSLEKDQIFGKNLRSISRSPMNAYFQQIKNESTINYQKFDQINQKVQKQFNNNKPLKSLTAFMKNLNSRLPKENQIKKHLKKLTNTNEKKCFKN